MEPKKVHYLTRRQADLPAGQDWLTLQEAAVLTGFQFPKRRRDWLLGRWTAKSALAQLMPAPLRPMTHWQIEADSDGAPVVRLDGQRKNIPISLSHSAGQAICVLSEEPMRMGCDLEKVETRSHSFEETFFTSGELKLLERVPAGDRASLVTLIWCAKESTLKALRTGLKADTRRVRLKTSLTGDHSQGNSRFWQNIETEDTQAGCTFYGWWREQKGMVITVVSDQPIDAPTAL
jgi:4'-phosphopantetheinyl transferase